MTHPHKDDVRHHGAAKMAQTTPGGKYEHPGDRAHRIAADPPSVERDAEYGKNPAVPKPFTAVGTALGPKRS